MPRPVNPTHMKDMHLVVPDVATDRNSDAREASEQASMASSSRRKRARARSIIDLMETAGPRHQNCISINQRCDWEVSYPTAIRSRLCSPGAGTCDCSRFTQLDIFYWIHIRI